jgi:hypothetical protein
MHNRKRQMANRSVTPELTASVAAHNLGMSRERVVRDVQRGKLRGRYDAEQGWLVDADAVEEYKRGLAVRGAR